MELPSQEAACGDRRIEMMMQGFKDSTISLTDNFSGLSYLVCTSVTDS